ncbi:hypothetical protein [Achromobacter phage Motura]|uniref:Uncharacterized protein n=1 Tax=Achromobacter phage Motura TaxID=2591403 RepID=A0A514CSX5_9CAUD|nr:hypothetical protein H1O15_gp224 [Achromobacter phage Motura]QDH83564.1 hypothetical protein [Achromobacter phage Motura]
MDIKKLREKEQRLERLTNWVDAFTSYCDKDANEWPVKAWLDTYQMANVDTLVATREQSQAVGFMASVVHSRATQWGLTLSVGAAMTIVSVSQTPGIAVMLLAVIKHHAVCNVGQDFITAEFIFNVMPNAPTPNNLAIAWDAQKTKDGNLLDQLGPDDFIMTAEETKQLDDLFGESP